MKGFVILLLGVIFVALITNSVPSIAEDDSGSNNADSEDADKLNIVPTVILLHCSQQHSNSNSFIR